jgi:hypothetical protein
MPSTALTRLSYTPLLHASLTRLSYTPLTRLLHACLVRLVVCGLTALANARQASESAQLIDTTKVRGAIEKDEHQRRCVRRRCVWRRQRRWRRTVGQRSGAVAPAALLCTCLYEQSRSTSRCTADGNLGAPASTVERGVV